MGNSTSLPPPPSTADDEATYDWCSDDSSDAQPPRVAVVGAGAAGLSAAWALSQRGVDVTVYEAAAQAGGHAFTSRVEVPGGEVVDCDMGFMVYNKDHYPNMTGMFERLGVSSEQTDMSFGVSLDDGTEWSSNGLAGVFATPSNAFSPSFYAMLRDMARFNKEAPALLALAEDDPAKHATLKECVATTTLRLPLLSPVLRQ